VFATLIRVLVILGVAVGAGYVRAKDLPWIPDLKALEAKHRQHETLRATIGIGLRELTALIDMGAVVIDARPPEAFAAGHLAIDCDPPVLNVPTSEIEAHGERLTQLQGLPVVLYCASNTCDDAEELYAALQQFGFVDIWIYFPGWDGILEAGLKTTTGPDTWTGFGGTPPEPLLDEAGASDGEEQPDANTPVEVEP
jgi:rhodanese-related sulfurtransferase